MYQSLQAIGRRVDTHKLLWCIGALLVAVMAAFQVYDLLTRRTIVLDTTTRTYASLARAISDQTRLILLGADLAVRDTANDAASARPPGNTMHQDLRYRLSAAPQVRSLLLLGADRRLVAGAGASQPAALLDQIVTTALQQQPSLPTGVSSVVRLHDGALRMLVLCRRVERANGKLVGVVAAVLDPDYFVRSYQSIELGPGTQVGLLDADGTLIAIAPASQAAIARLTAEQAVYGEVFSRSGTGTVVTHTLRGGQEMTSAIQPLSGFPLFVVAAVDNITVLEAWNIQAMHSGVRTTLFCLAVLLLLTLVLRQLRRRERAEAGLRVQTALLDELFESAPEAIVMLDADQCVTRVNREFSRMFGFTPEQAGGRPLIDLIVPDDMKENARRMAESVRAGRHASSETMRMRRDGTRLHVSELGAPITEAESNVASYAIYRDITERKLAEAERSKLESRLRQAEKMEAIGTMAGGIAHDFNSVIAAILGYGEMARNAALQTGALTRYVDNVLSAANRAKALVDQILTYSRTTRGKRSVVNPRLVLLETLELVRASLPADIDLRIQLSTDQASVVADTTQVHQIVMNLCMNAVQAMHAGGTLSVALDAVDIKLESKVSHGLLAAGHYLRLSVHDTGCGMAPEVLERIFEPFFTTKEPGQGTGLGLALVQGIVSELGGAIDVTSQLAAGSTFHLYLPRSDAITVGTIDAVASLPRGAGQQVLVVEDESPLMLLTEEMLASLGYEPAGYDNPSEALDDFREAPFRFDAAVLDYLMPGMTGTELTKQLRAVHADIPVVLVSAYEGPLLLHEAIASGIEHIITKPLTLQELAETMAKVFRQMSAR